MHGPSCRLARRGAASSRRLRQHPTRCQRSLVCSRLRTTSRRRSVAYGRMGAVSRRSSSVRPCLSPTCAHTLARTPLRKAAFDSSSNPHSKDGPNPSSFPTQLWCSSSIGWVDCKLRHLDCAAKCSGPSICPRRRHSHPRRLHSAPSHWSHFADNARQIHFERPCCAGVQHNWLIRARAGLKQTRDMPRGSMPLVCSPVFRN